MTKSKQSENVSETKAKRNEKNSTNRISKKRRGLKKTKKIIRKSNLKNITTRSKLKAKTKTKSKSRAKTKTQRQQKQQTSTKNKKLMTR